MSPSTMEGYSEAQPHQVRETWMIFYIAKVTVTKYHRQGAYTTEIYILTLLRLEV